MRQHTGTSGTRSARGFRKSVSFSLRSILSAAGILAAAGAAFYGLRTLLSNRRHYQKLLESIDQRENDAVEYAFVVNPSKPGAKDIEHHIVEFCKENGIPNPMIIETHLDKDGKACAQEAIRRGANVVVAAGGDGTVRTVAEGVAGTDHAMAVLPVGTANLFARNLGIPLDLDEALRVAISHGSRKVDMGRMTLLDAKKNRSHGFLLISGIGMDASMIQDTDPALKKRMGWLAYVLGAFPHLMGRKEVADISVTDKDGNVRRASHVSFRTFLIGNCGQIPLVTLMPDADYSDGLLDFELLDTDGGLIGWNNLAFDMIHQTIWHRSGQRLISPGSTVKQGQGTHAELRLRHSALAEVDGDLLTTTKHVAIDVDKQALTVRVPEIDDEGK